MLFREKELKFFSPGAFMEEKFLFRKISSPDELQEAYKTRFQVYGNECHFLKESDYPQGFETDEFDRYSVHFGGFDSLGRMVGTVRLILPHSPRFPIEELRAKRLLVPRGQPFIGRRGIKGDRKTSNQQKVTRKGWEVSRKEESPDLPGVGVELMWEAGRGNPTPHLRLKKGLLGWDSSYILTPLASYRQLFKLP